MAPSLHPLSSWKPGVARAPQNPQPTRSPFGASSGRKQNAGHSAAASRASTILMCCHTRGTNVQQQHLQIRLGSAYPRRRSSKCSSPTRRGARAALSEAQTTVAGDDMEAAQDLNDVQDIINTMELLKEKRFMTVSEVRLVLMIEDPREAERRRQLGIENESGCSRDEIASAFMDVMEDRVPADRLVLRTLAQELREWPGLQDKDDAAVAAQERREKRRSLYAEVTNVGLPEGRRNTADWDAAADATSIAATAAKEQQKDLGETLPSWVGYGVLYGVSFIPIIIGVVVVVILFLNSLQ